MDIESPILSKPAEHMIPLKDAAVVLGLNPRQVRKMCRAGTFKGRKILGQWFVQVGYLRRYVLGGD